MSTANIPILEHISAFRPDAIAWICDIWGVLHNGVSVFPPAIAACIAFRRRGGRIVLMSNAPRPSVGVVAQLDALGVPATAYDAVLTSGDVARAQLRAWRGIATLHIGPVRDQALFGDLGVPLVGAADAARVVCSGLFDDTTETPETYRELLVSLAERRLPMLCANPDIKVDRGGRIIYCGGAVAALYAALGGAVTYAGKPHGAIYDVARRQLADLVGHDVATAAIVAIGDGVHTDIAGAIAAGLPSVYIASAIHTDGALTADTLEKLFPDAQSRPTAAMAALDW